MPVDGTRVTTMYAHAMPGPPQSFSAKAEAVPEAALTTMYDHRAYRRRRGLLSIVFLLKGLLYAGTR